MPVAANKGLDFPQQQFEKEEVSEAMSLASTKDSCEEVAMCTLFTENGFSCAFRLQAAWVNLPLACVPIRLKTHAWLRCALHGHRKNNGPGLMKTCFVWVFSEAIRRLLLRFV